MLIQTIEQLFARRAVALAELRALGAHERLGIQEVGIDEAREEHPRVEGEGEAIARRIAGGRGSFSFGGAGKASRISGGMKPMGSRCHFPSRCSGWMFAFVVGQSGMVPRDAVGQEPTRRAATCRMLGSGRRVIDPAPDLRLVNAVARFGTRA